ncbi:hypothetical protein CRE_02912 [Caenorhabditis remanei]|uniref:Uncharacterized protein n=1 Tax=Caenorhabditis remanei TaxID=31234 RepID=E3LWM7_CAERE|nr:hypothetical protein CRE_02912 [Caenorhabditis remanei]
MMLQQPPSHVTKLEEYIGGSSGSSGHEHDSIRSSTTPENYDPLNTCIGIAQRLRLQNFQSCLALLLGLLSISQYIMISCEKLCFD